MPLESFSQIVINKNKKKKTTKAPAYPWQELALSIIKDLNVPNFKKSSVFKACKENNAETVKTALNDTKELCKEDASWQYFFKVISSLKQQINEKKQ